MLDISTKPQHYLYPLRNSGVSLYYRVFISDTLRRFYIVQRRHLLTLNNLETRVISNPFRKDVWICKMDGCPIKTPHAQPGLDNSG